MEIRRAEPRDLGRIGILLLQVHDVHSAGRPDIFRRGNRKYNDAELREIIGNERTPVFVALDGEGTVVGYAFCILEEHVGEAALTDRKTLYVDDLCVDEGVRGQHVGSALYAHVKAYAASLGCAAVTLNVWCLNEGALRFYEKQGMKPLKIVMEDLLGT